MSSQTKKDLLRLSKKELMKLSKMHNIKGYNNCTKLEMIELLLKSKSFKKAKKTKKSKKKKLSIDQKNQYIVHGYYHETNIKTQIPLELVITVINYYGIISIGRFDLCPQDAKQDILHNGLIIHRTTEVKKLGRHVSYVNHKLLGRYFHGSSKGYNKGKHEWKLRINKLGKSNIDAIGIIYTTTYFREIYWLNDFLDRNGTVSDGIHYVRPAGMFSLSGLELFKTGSGERPVEIRKYDGWREGDVITIGLDCDKCEATVRISDGISVDSVEVVSVQRKQKYYFFVYCASCGTEYELMSQW